MTKIVTKKDRARIVIADDAGLIYSDDWRNGWRSGFSEIGCLVDVVDISQLRRAVAAGPFSARGSNAAAALADVILSKRPDLVWCHHGRAAGNEFFLSKLRRNGIPTAVYLCDEPYEVGETIRYSPKFDYVFSMDYETVGIHLAARPFGKRANVFYLPPCADAQLFVRRPYEGRSLPAFFLGNPTLHPRSEWLRLVERNIPGADVRYWPQNGKPVGKGNKLWIPANEHPKWYANTVVGLNIHRHPGITKECFKTRVQARQKSWPIPHGFNLPVNPPKVDGTGFWNDFDLPASHVNPRAMEFFAAGTIVVSDDSRSELARMFPMAPRAATPQRFLELVQYYLEHRNEAELLGKECSSLISKRHTYRHRAFEVLTRLGLSKLVPEFHVSSLGEPQDFLTPQDFTPLRDSSSSERTGRSEPWSPAYGLSLTTLSGDPSLMNTLAPPPIVLPS